MWFLRNVPIKRKLMLVMMTTTSAALLLAAGGLFAYEVRVFRDTLLRELQTLANVLAIHISPAVNFQMRDEASESLNALLAEPQILSACVYLPNGEILASYIRPGAAAEFPKKPEPDGEIFYSDHIALFSSIIHSASQPPHIGTLYIQADFLGMRNRQRLYLGIIALVLVVSSLAAFLLSVWLQRFISGPVLALADTALAVSQAKDYSVRSPKTSEDELGDLTDAFNEMLAQIQEQDRALRKAKDELELRVKERTQELQMEITQRKRIEEALRVSEVRFRSLAQSANDAIVLAGWDGKIIFWNHGAHKLFGFEENEILGRRLEVLMPPRYREAHRKGLDRYHATRKSNVIGKTVEMHGLRKDGTEFPLELNLSTWETNEGTFFSGIIRDITERKQVEETLRTQAMELKRSNADLEQFAYVASHDLQEPLRMVANYTQLLARRYKDKLDSSAHEFINFAVDGATRMQRLINDLLEYSRVGTRGREFSKADLSSALGQAVLNLRSVIQETGAMITNDDLPEVMADSTQLTQLLQNLIGNALKFRGQEAPRIHISAQSRPSDWLISVRDNGIGIAPEYAERIFVIFQRLHGYSEYPGTGIGLAVCKKIVERHGGTIWVESQPGEGATFHFTLPKQEVKSDTKHANARPSH